MFVLPLQLTVGQQLTAVAQLISSVVLPSPCHPSVTWYQRFCWESGLGARFAAMWHTYEQLVPSHSTNSHGSTWDVEHADAFIPCTWC